MLYVAGNLFSPQNWRKAVINSLSSRLNKLQEAALYLAGSLFSPQSWRRAVVSSLSSHMKKLLEAVHLTGRDVCLDRGSANARLSMFNSCRP